MDNKIKNVLLHLKNLDAILISSVPNIIYLTGYSGFSYFEREAFLLITQKQNFLITDGRYSEAVSQIPGFEILEVQSGSLYQTLKRLSSKIKKLGIEEYDLSVGEYKKLKKYFKLKNLEELENLRILKSKNEISKIQKACKIADLAFDFILGKLKTGITEKEIAFELEMFIKKTGSDPSFPPIVAFGKNSSMPHYKTNNEKLITNNIVLLDFGAKFENYCSDMTRTVFFGKADEKFKKIYGTVLDAQKRAAEQLNNLSINGKWAMVNGKSIDDMARNHIVQSGYPSIPHSLGHGIGIEVHESPRLSPKSKDILKPGMVFSIEPGIYTKGFGGVRIEDLFVLEKNNLRPLTHSPKNLIEI